MKAQRSFGLDCVRASAILLVLVCHSAVMFSRWFGFALPLQLAVGGFYGVELFFVLSGFLIGRIILGLLDRQAGLRDWGVFLVRRWMRTLPLYYVTLLLLALAWRPRFWVPGHATLWRDLPWFVTMTQNFAWQTVDHWFAVSWSLGVEEWFYVLFPALLVVVASVARGSVAFWVVTLIFLIAPAVLRWQITTSQNWDELTSKMVLCRLDAIGFGLVAAYGATKWRIGDRSAAWWFAAGAVVTCLHLTGWTNILFASERARETLAFDVISAGFALCLPWFAKLRVPRLAAVEFGVTWLSAIAYPVYLCHFTILEVASFNLSEYRLLPWLAMPATVIVILGFASLLHRIVEQPIMARRPRQTP